MFLSCDTSHYLFSPYSVVLLENITGSQLFKNSPAVYGTRRFNTLRTRASHLSLSRPSSVQSMPTHPTSWRSILIIILPSALGCSRWSLYLRLPHQTVYTPPLSPVSARFHAHLILLDLITRTLLGEEYSSLRSCSFPHSPVTSSLLGRNKVQPITYRIFPLE